MLHDQLIPFTPLLGSVEWMFHEDNATCHVFKTTQELFKNEKQMFHPVLVETEI